MATQPFNQQQALKHWTVLSRLISVGAYTERQHDGPYGEGGIERSIDNLEHQAAQHGLQFVWHQDIEQWSLELLPAEQKAAFLHVNVENLTAILAETAQYLNSLPYQSALDKSARESLNKRIQEAIEQSYRVPVIQEETTEDQRRREAREMGAPWADDNEQEEPEEE